MNRFGAAHGCVTYVMQCLLKPFGFFDCIQSSFRWEGIQATVRVAATRRSLSSVLVGHLVVED